jgi:hypothetical protein
MKRVAFLLSAALLIAVACSPARAHADDETAGLVKAGVDALAAGKTAEAIATFEALADRGVVDANMSLDRGLSYAQRVKLGADAPGDLGRAAHGFEEARALAPDPALAAEATRALATLRTEVARRRARTGEAPSLEPGAPIVRSVAHLSSESGWAWLSIAASLLLGVGLFVRGLGDARRAKIGGAICASIAAPTLVLSCALTLTLKDERLNFKEAVVVVPSARLTDDAHRPLPQSPMVPEAARVELVDSRAGWAHVRWGALDGWVSSSAVRAIARAQ